MNLPKEYLAVALSAAVGVSGAGWASYAALCNRVDSLEAEVHTEYTTKEESDKSLDRIYTSLGRIEEKLDAFIVSAPR
jgi:hypothetical protein